MKIPIECDEKMCIEFSSLEAAREKLPEGIGGRIVHGLPHGRCIYFPPGRMEDDINREMKGLTFGQCSFPQIVLAHEICSPERDYEVTTCKHVTEKHVVHASSKKEAERKAHDGRYNPGESVETAYAMRVTNVKLKEEYDR